MKVLLRALFIFAVLVDGSAGRADEPFYPRDGQTIVFFGDSITQAGLYVEYVETFLRTRFPEKSFRVINHGISSETVSGTSEPDHDPRRPDAHNRFARDVAAWRPDVLVACFGMNDGNYHPFERDRFEKYQAGVRRLIARARDEAGAALVLMTPPPFDPYRRGAGDPAAVSFGYKFAAIDYDNTLTEYSRWLVGVREEGFIVADVHSALNEHLRQRRESRVSFTLSPDAVHPDATGHWLMAQTLLEAWHAPAECGSVEIDAAGPKAVRGEVSGLARNGEAMEFVWRAPLPLPLDSRCDAESIALADVAQRLNRQRLTVTAAPAKRYRLIADGTEIGQFSRDELAAGIDLTIYPAMPTNQRAQEVLKLVQERSKLIYTAWRKTIAIGAEDEKAKQDQAAADAQAEEMDARLRKLCQPIDVKLELSPADSR